MSDSSSDSSILRPDSDGEEESDNVVTGMFYVFIDILEQNFIPVSSDNFTLVI